MQGVAYGTVFESAFEGVREYDYVSGAATLTFPGWRFGRILCTQMSFNIDLTARQCQNPLRRLTYPQARWNLIHAIGPLSDGTWQDFRSSPVEFHRARGQPPIQLFR